MRLGLISNFGLEASAHETCHPPFSFLPAPYSLVCSHMSDAREFIVESQDAGKRLDHYLTEQLPDHSRSRIQALMKSGHVHHNGDAARASEKARLGDKVTFSEPPPTPSENIAEDIALEVLFEDEDLIVINKPVGLVVHPAVGHASGTLVNALLHHCEELSGVGGVERPGIVHRLDKETSGCLVAAKNDTAHNALATQFAGREVKKIYLAIASGRLLRKNGKIEAPIGRHKVNRQKMAVVKVEHGRDARTDWRVLMGLSKHTLVECTLHTGRTHQIRVHLKHLGFPIAGDDIYGKRGEFPRVMLHAWKLGFNHPRTGKWLDFCAPVPADFIAAGVPAELK